MKLMYESLIQYIQNYSATQLSQEAVETVKNSFFPKKLRKKQYFLQEGEVCKYFAFIVKGAMRQYSVDDKGIEHIVHLSIENWWVGDRESYIMLTPSTYNIDAWEETELLTITRADQLNLLDKMPSIASMIRHMDERNAIANQRRLNSTISNTADKRYEDFVNCHPDFIQRFPQHLIASYLGITKSSLSRIRNQSAQK
jgi:CRP-like cAMP-binding protein